MKKLFTFTLLLLIFTAHTVFGQEITVTGTVSDQFGPLAGATIVVEGTSIGTVTGTDGTYSISVPSPESVLLFSFVGFETHSETVGDRRTIDVTLDEVAQDLEEVVVIGYGTTTVKELTSAVTSVKTEDLEKSGADANIDMMLMGRVPGLNMGISSGQPGARVDINIRGAISPNANNSPLFIIDGVPMTSNTANFGSVRGSGNLPFETGLDQSPLNTINPNDIESIDVLKDASAAAIYGSAAANGVIIITTKRGRAGKTQISYEGTHTMSNRKSYNDQLYDGPSFMRYQNLYYKEQEIENANIYPYRGSSGGFTDYNSDGSFDMNDYDAAWNDAADYYSESDIAEAETFDWIDFIMDDAWVAEHNLSINGGNDRSQYFGSYNFYHNDGLLVNSGLTRHNFRFNFDQNIFDWMDLGISFNYSNVNTDNASSGGPVPGRGIGTGTLITSAFAMTPYIDDSIDPATGKYQKGLNEQLTSPAGVALYQDKIANNRVFLSPTLTMRLAEGLTFKAVQGFDSQFSRRDQYVPLIAGNYRVPDGQGTVANNENTNTSTEGFFNYNQTWENHRLDAVLGAGYYYTAERTVVAQSTGFFTDAFITDKLQAGSNQDERFTGSARSAVTKLSQFGRLSYTFRDRYTILGTLRRDGSSYFAKNHKWGIFPSISGAWRISGEPWAQIDWLTNLKLRAGYGSAGNEPRNANSLAVYAAEELTGAGTEIAYGLITAGGYLGGVQLSTAANPDLKWETDETINVGLDYGLFRQRISGSVDYFIRRARDLLDYKTLPSQGLVDEVIANIGSTEARGVELELNSINVSRADFVWESNFNVSYTRYRWLERNPDLVLDSWVPVTAEMSAIYGWETNGIFTGYEQINSYTNSGGDLLQPKAMPGNLRYVDYNGDGVLDDNDNHFLGVRTPPWRFGLNNRLQYRNLALSFYFYGAAGHMRNRDDRSTRLGNATNQGNGWSKNIDRYWTVFNADGDWPGIGQDYTDDELRTGGGDDFWLMKANWLKLRYVTLNYDFSSALVQRIGLGSLSLHVTAQNLLTLTNWKGYDPETSKNTYPQTYSFTFGVKVTY